MMASIFIRGWFILMITINLLSIDAEQAVSKKCLSGSDKCYTLFRADHTWWDAHDECLHKEQYLATIQDAQTQSIMEQFAEDQNYPEEAAHAWVAGRRSDDMTWRDLNGKLFSYIGGIGSDGDGSCLLLNGAEGLSATDNLHLVVPCDSHSTHYKAVCEYDETSDGCPNDHNTIHQPSVNKWNKVTVRLYRSWQDAREYCQSHGWELAHTGAGNWDFYNRLTSTVKQPIGNEAGLWIGVQRRSWVWKAGYSQEIYPVVTYWRSGEGLNSREDCMHIELNAEGLWADKACDATSAYFICQDYQDQPAQGTKDPTIMTTASKIPITGTKPTSATTTLATTTTTTPTAATTTTTTPTNKAPTPAATSTKTKAPTTMTLKTGPPINRESPTVISMTTVYIIIGVVGGVLVAVIIIVVVVVCVRRKRTGNQVENVDSRTRPPPEGDVYAVPIKNRNRNPGDDLEIVDNEMYGAGLDYPIRNRDTNSDNASENRPIKNRNRNPDDDLEIVDNEMYGAV